MILGVDPEGTFTDFVLLREPDPDRSNPYIELDTHKVLSSRRSKPFYKG